MEKLERKTQYFVQREVISPVTEFTEEGQVLWQELDNIRTSKSPAWQLGFGCGAYVSALVIGAILSVSGMLRAPAFIPSLSDTSNSAAVPLAWWLISLVSMINLFLPLGILLCCERLLTCRALAKLDAKQQQAIALFWEAHPEFAEEAHDVLGEWEDVGVAIQLKWILPSDQRAHDWTKRRPMKS